MGIYIILFFLLSFFSNKVESRFLLKGAVLINTKVRDPSYSGPKWIHIDSQKDIEPNIIVPQSRMFHRQKNSTSWPVAIVKMFADLSFAAYHEKDFEIPEGVKLNASYGWDEYGPRMHIFESEDDSIVVFSVKGTTFIQPFGDKVYDIDRFEDNLMFSCCCGSNEDPTFAASSTGSVCNCADRPKVNFWLRNRQSKVKRPYAAFCDQSCIEESVQDPSTYFEILKINVERYISERKVSQIFFTGHSLGGALSSLLAQYIVESDAKFSQQSVSAFAFGAPGERQFGSRLGLYSSNSISPYVNHFGVSSDPIFSGTCNGKYSLCTLAGYFLETKCHVGNVCMLDADSSPNPPIFKIGNHRMINYISVLESMSFNASIDCKSMDLDCRDCTSWTFL